MKHIIFTLLLLFSFFSFSQPAQFEPRGIGGGGALFSPSMNPGNPDEFFVACDMTELFHTTDRGQSYEVIDFREFQADANSAVRFTNVPGLLYSIFYIVDYSTNQLEGRPVRSRDGGQTWDILPGDPDPTEEIFTLHVDYDNPSRVVMSNYYQLFYSADSGNTFTTIYQTSIGNGLVLGGAFFDGPNIYLGTNLGVFQSSDGGSSFQTSTVPGLPNNERIFSFAAAKQGGTTRFFCLTGDAADVYAGLRGSDYWGFLQGIYSADAGATPTWTPRLTGIDPTNDFMMFVAMAENDINTIYAGGSNPFEWPHIFKSTDAGLTWTSVFTQANNQNVVTGWCGDGGDRPWGYAGGPFGISVARNDADKVLISDLGFVHKTDNGATTWEQAYLNPLDANPVASTIPSGKAYRSIGLENTSCWQVHWIDAQNMIACYSDIRGTRSQDGGNSWSFDYTGHNQNTMYRVVSHQVTGVLYAGTSTVHDIYHSTRLTDATLDAANAGKVIYSNDQGDFWQDLNDFGHPVFWVALDPNAPNTLYASVIHSTQGGVFMTQDVQNGASATWTKLPNPPRTEGHPATIEVLNDGKVLATYSGRRNASGFTASSGVFLFDPGTNMWTDLSDPGMHYWTKDLMVDPGDLTQNTWYVSVFSGWGGPPNGLGGLYRTTDRGISWTKINSLDRVSSTTIDPNHSDVLYLTTETEGLWISNDMNNPAPNFVQVQSYPFRQPERVFFNPFDTKEIWVTSFGHGLRVGYEIGTEGLPDVKNQLAIRAFPNPASDNFQVEIGGSGKGAWQLNNLQGQAIAIGEFGKDPFQRRIEVSLSEIPQGIYLLQIIRQKERNTAKIMIER